MTSLRRALIGLAVLAFAIGLGSLALILTSDHESPRGLAAALTLVTGWGFAGAGLFAWDRRPGNRTGPLMTAIGFTWFLRALGASNNDVVFTFGALCFTIPFAVLIHLLVTFPSGRLETRTQRALVGVAYFITTVMQAAWVLFADPEREGCEGCPDNAARIGDAGIGEAISTAQGLIAIPLIAATVVMVYRRWRRTSPGERQVLTPVLSTGGLAFVFLLTQLTISAIGVSDAAELAAFVAAIAIFACLPFAFLVGLLRSRIGRDEEIRTALTAENAQLTAELQASVEELRASRARIVEAGYAERRRVERDLHDGAQQRLVALTMNLRLARERLDSDPTATAELLDEGLEELAVATSELRELARGIHPAVLSDRGLEAAIESLAERSPVPVEILETPDERLPESVESTSYFVIAEALTNVARYANAESATVRVAQTNGVVEIEVRDDGVGGADPESGSGLRGLADRVAALEGRFDVSGEAGEGTTVRARIPCA
jgi:signal transduction histidine kinase